MVQSDRRSGRLVVNLPTEFQPINLKKVRRLMNIESDRRSGYLPEAKLIKTKSRTQDFSVFVKGKKNRIGQSGVVN